MEQYKELLKHILNSGDSKEDRTGVGTISTFGYQTRYDLSKGFPLVTIKRTPFRIIAEELLWFISGNTNIRPLLEKNVHIWDEWAFRTWVESVEYKCCGLPDMTNFGVRAIEDREFAENYKIIKEMFCNRILNDEEFAKKYGELGPVYGEQWTSWSNYRDVKNVKMSVDFKKNKSDIDAEITFGEINQLEWVIEEIKRNPSSRRLIVSSWNPSDIPFMELPPCHCFYQFYVKNGKLSCQLYQRSCDSFLGIPFNIASYALLTHMVAHICDLEVGEFIHTCGDLHLYNNQIEQTKLILEREPMELPELRIKRKVDKISDFTFDDFELVGYKSHGVVKAEVAV